jgi:hypothetical protein
MTIAITNFEIACQDLPTRKDAKLDDARLASEASCVSVDGVQCAGWGKSIIRVGFDVTNDEVFHSGFKIRKMVRVVRDFF